MNTVRELIKSKYTHTFIYVNKETKQLEYINVRKYEISVDFGISDKKVIDTIVGRKIDYDLLQEQIKKALEGKTYKIIYTLLPITIAESNEYLKSNNIHIKKN
jgi:hypothetical protein